ncbi:MAG: hypothetical protein M9894_16265 [Planctomycetes bacterium]|nr:hypothetical protein [Planctomycetota bacterium]
MTVDKATKERLQDVEELLELIVLAQGLPELALRELMVAVRSVARATGYVESVAEGFVLEDRNGRRLVIGAGGDEGP